MPKGGRTTLFVSSTCYDLAQLRADVKDFAVAMGLEPILSEMGSFPVNPSQSTVQNCLNAVRTHADLFLLVVGGRYGSMNETGKSITNLEYVEAAARGMPIYVFVKRDILSILSIWRANPDADFSSTVDTPKLFEFVANLRDKGEVWVFPFTNAQDITDTLRTQLSYLFSESLDLRGKLQSTDAPTLMLEPEALRIYIEKPKGWEYLAFAKILQDSVASHYKQRLDLELGISFGKVIDLQNREAAVHWVLSKFNQITQITSNLSRVLNGGIVTAVGEPGNIQRIEHVASRIADAYLQAIEWTLEFNRLNVEPELEKLMHLASNFSSNMLGEIELFSTELYGKLQFALANHSPGEAVNFTLTLSAPETGEFTEEIQRIANTVERNP